MTRPATNHLDTVVFDLDGTLVDSLTDIVLSFQYAFGQLGLEVPDEASVRAEVGKPLDEMYLLFAPQADVTMLVDLYREHYPLHFTDHSALFPGVADLLTDLRSRGLKLAVATTKRSDMAKSLADAVGLSPLVDHVQGTDDFPHKPKPDVILHALRGVGGTGGWMVGDTRTDIQAGKAAGLKTYAVTWGTHDREQLAAAEPDALEPDLNKLLTLV
ncbi:HAD family hydrolase [soil metagenome]